MEFGLIKLVKDFTAMIKMEKERVINPIKG